MHYQTIQMSRAIPFKIVARDELQLDGCITDPPPHPDTYTCTTNLPCTLIVLPGDTKILL